MLIVLKQYSRTHSGGGATFWLDLTLETLFCLRFSALLLSFLGIVLITRPFLDCRFCAMPTLRQVNRFLQTTDIRQPRFSATPLLVLKYHGNISAVLFWCRTWFCTAHRFWSFSFCPFDRYGIEQEYTLLQKNVKWPLGWPSGGYPGPQVIVTPILLLC